MKKPRSKTKTTKKRNLQGKKHTKKNLRGKNTARRKTTRRKGKGLGDASNASFVQGGNQIQTFVLLFFIAIIILFLLPNVNKMFDYFTGKKPTTDPNKTDPNIQEGGVKNNVYSGGGVQTQKENVPNLQGHDLTRWLLQKAGFYNGVVNLGANVYGSNSDATNQALTRFSQTTGVGKVGVTLNWNPLIIDYLRNKGAINGYRRQMKRLNGNPEKPLLLRTPI